MSDWLKDFLKSTVSAALIAMVASGFSAYVWLKIQQVMILEIQKDQRRIERKLDRYMDKMDKRIENITRDIYRPSFK